MKKIIASGFIVALFLVPFLWSEFINTKEIKTLEPAPLKLSIIVGSVRTTSTGKMIAKNLKNVLLNRNDIVTEIIFVTDYTLPFYTDSASPASVQEVTDPVLKKWSNVIAQSDICIIVAPEYNGGYPAGLKNALDSLYKEWNHKPVGIVAYSGGISGGISMINQLKIVLEALEMIPVATSIKIPQSWKAFDKKGTLHRLQEVEKDLMLMTDELLKAYKNKKNE